MKYYILKLTDFDGINYFTGGIPLWTDDPKYAGIFKWDDGAYEEWTGELGNLRIDHKLEQICISDPNIEELMNL